MKPIRLGLHGKVPASGDFLRRHSDPGTVALIDSCCQAATEVLGRPAAVFAEAGPVASLLRQGGRWQLMVWLPSQDAVGRPYPLVVHGALPPQRGDDDPLVLGGLLLGCCAAVLGAVDPRSLDEGAVDAVLTGLRCDTDPEAAARRADGLLQGAAMAELWREAWGEAAGDAGRRAVAGLLGHCAGHASPLAIDGIAHPALAVFWLLAATMLRGDEVPSLLTLHPTWRQGPPRLHLAWGAYPAEVVASCLWPDPHQTSIARVGAAVGVTVPPWLDRAFEQSGDRPADLLYALGHPELA